MNITNDTLLQIENIIKSAKFIDISELIITNDLVRGINNSKTGFILSNLELPDDFKPVAINRLDIYNQRFNLVKDSSECKITAKIKQIDQNENNSIEYLEYVEQINFKSKSIKVQFRCCNPSLIKAPKVINDKDTYTVKFTEDDINLLNKASTSIDTENIKLIGSNEGLSYEYTDLSGDNITINSDSNIECDADNFNFSFSFVQKPFLQLLKKCENFEFILGSKGILKITVNNIVFYLLPQI